MKIMENILKKWLLAFGLILICVGFILMSASSLTRETKTLELVASTNDAWSISDTFERDDKMLVTFRQANDWWKGFFETEEGMAVLYVYIHIFDPQNDETRFEVILTPSQPGYPGLLVLNISATKTDGLDISSVKDAQTGLIKGIGGTVQYNGTYRAVVDVYPPRQSPPYTLELYKEKTEKQYPYTFLFPGGAAIGVVGTTISLFGLKSGKHRISSKSRKIRISPLKKNAPAAFPSRVAESWCAQQNFPGADADSIGILSEK